MRNRVASSRRYIICHRLHRLTAIAITVGAISCWLGTAQITVPGTEEPLKIVLRRFLPAILACLAAGSMHSPLDWLENITPAAQRRAGTHVIAATTIGAAIVIVSETLATRDGDPVVLLRAYLLWTALAVVSGRLFGWTLSWALPVISLVPVISLGSGSHATAQWWGWATEGPDNLKLWGVTAFLGLIAAASH